MNTYYAAIDTLLGTLALWVFWYVFWKDYVVDKFRQDLFKLRNDLFIDTMDGKAPFGFDSHEYRKMVQVLNVSIRHIENMTVLRFTSMYMLKFIFAQDRRLETLDETNQPITSATTPEARTFLKDYQCMHGKYTLRYLATISPTFVVFVATVILTYVP